MFDLREVQIDQIKHLFEKYHGYGSVGNLKTYAFAVFENSEVVAAYVWLPPPPGAAKNVCKNAPEGVLALSRMVAVPKNERKLKHISKPLKKQFKLIDRGRWPILITYSDEGQGHTGYVYQCSGMSKTIRSKVNYYTNENGQRVSSYRGGKTITKGLHKGGFTFINRWEHWICDKRKVRSFMRNAGWRKVSIPGKVWKSGNQAYKLINIRGK